MTGDQFADSTQVDENDGESRRKKKDENFNSVQDGQG